MHKVYTYDGEVTSVYDGDTFDVCLDVCPDLPRYITVRIIGANCPEIDDKDPGSRVKALTAKAFVVSRLLHKKVVVKTKWEKSFTRILCEVTIEGRNFAEELIVQGHAQRVSATRFA